MALKVVWSPLAQQKRKDILNYWTEQNQSNTYSIKLNTLFKEAINLVSIYPNIGRKSDINNVRIKIVRDYLIFYSNDDKNIYVLTIWDNRQDPEKIALI